MTAAFLDYAKIEAEHWSALKHMAKSPKQYRYVRDNPSEDTAGRLKGRGTHTAVLEPQRFLLDYALFKGKIRRGKEWDAFVAVHPEENILKREEYEHCLRVAKCVQDHPAAQAILLRAKREQTIQWIDEETGLHCKARLDLYFDGIGDLKGVRSVHPRMLGAEVARMMYHGQLAFYREGVRVTTGENLPCYLICVEHTAPHDVVVRELDDDALYAGWELARSLLNRVAECRAANHWPGISDEIETLDLPAWVWPEDEQVMSANLIEDEEVANG